MQYGKYYVDSMPVGDDTADTYCVVYLGDPNVAGYDYKKGEVGNFTITEAEEKSFGSLDAAISAYMHRYHLGIKPADKWRYRRLKRRERRLQTDTVNMIRCLLTQYGGRISYHPEPDGDGYAEYPVSMALYYPHDNPTINLTDVYQDEDGILRVDGADEEGSINRGFQLYPEHYSCVLDFITIALGLDRPSPWSKFAARMESRIVKCFMAILVSVSRFLHLDPLSKVYRRVRSCTDYSTAYKILEESGLILSEYGCHQKASGEHPELSYAYYTADGSCSNPRGITVIYTFQQTDRDTYVADKITSIVCNR